MYSSSFSVSIFRKGPFNSSS